MQGDLISRRAVLEILDDRFYDTEYPSELEELERKINNIPSIKIDGNTSDGYHTFNELYDHRAKLFSVIVRDHSELCWKSKLHHDGMMYDGMFIVGINTPQGQASYHYDIDPYWDMFQCKEMERAPEWDGHTPAEAINRIAALDVAPVVNGEFARLPEEVIPCLHVNPVLCKTCNTTFFTFNKEGKRLMLCPYCGARMDGEENAAD